MFAQAPLGPLPPIGPAASQGSAPPTTTAPGWSQLQNLNRRVEALEAENAQLRQVTASPVYPVAPASFASDLDAPAGCEQPATACGCEKPGGDGCCGACPKCGKQVCEGLPHLCGVCLDKLSWNKAGGWRIVPFGRLRGEAIYSTAPQTGDAVIAFLNPNNPGISEDQATVHAKQSQLNFAVTGPDTCGYQVGGTFLMNFMGAQPLRNFSGANIVLAYGEFKNDRWRYAFGRMLDLYGPIAPTTVNQLSQRGAGNIGIYRGAFHLDRFITVSDMQKWTVSGRISQQDISDYAGVPGIRGKDNGWPNIEGRVGLELGPLCDYGHPLEVGLSGVLGETQAVADQAIDNGGIFYPAIDDVAQTRGAALDFQLKGPILGFRTEVWWGQAAGTYFVATLQSLNPETAQAVESVGGWAEVYCRVNPRMTMHVGYGVDDPRNQDLGFLGAGPGQISYNEVAWCNAIWNVTEYFELALEVSHRRTRYIDPTAANEGILFHFASTLKF